MTFNSTTSALPDDVAQQTSLEICRVSEIHRSRMASCLREFTIWCTARGQPLDEAWASPALMAGILAHYVQSLRDAGYALCRARLTVLAVQSADRALRGQLKRAWDAVASWQLQAPLRNRRPVPADVSSGIALALVLHGSRQPREFTKFWVAGMLVRLGFGGLMRPGEFLNLTFGDLCIPPLGRKTRFW